MSDPAAQHRFSGLARLKLFWALSRTPHGLLDMCTPAFAALLWLGSFPAVEVILDRPSDHLRRLHGGLCPRTTWSTTASTGKRRPPAVLRPPAATSTASSSAIPWPRGSSASRKDWLWALFWSAVALIGAFILNPVCVVIFVGGCAAGGGLLPAVAGEPLPHPGERGREDLRRHGSRVRRGPAPSRRRSWRRCFSRCSSGKSAGRTSPTT
ncbi:MAG: hypothetical protein MZV70_71700 [Desulfobacterales bacterium]|nr:hypothetical protein [Desulfobacterales bacterium]